MKKTIITLLAIMLAAQAWARVDGLHWFNYNGLHYRLSNNEVTLWESESYKKLKTVTIPETVTYKKNIYKVTEIIDAFSGCSGLTSITIPNSVTNIGYGAFENCSSLTSITIPNSVTKIGPQAFSGCSGLTSITIPNSVTYIDYEAFENCSGLTSVYIPNSVTSIGRDAFDGCSRLTSINIESEVALSGAHLYFSKDGVRYRVLNKESVKVVSKSYTGEVAIPETVTVGNTFTVTSIGSDAFKNCSGLTSVTIPNSVTSIGESAFDGCSSLTSVYIPNSVTSIGEGAFAYCKSLTSIYIPNSVTSIGKRAFENCENLSTIYIPNSVTSIGYSAFENCSSLTSVYIPNSVTSIGEGAFAYCKSLTSIYIPNSVTSIGKRAFENCKNLSTIYIPNSVTKIEDRAFYGCSITSVYIPNSVTSIGKWAFNGCKSLTSVYISKSVTYIGIGAFYLDNAKIMCEAQRQPQNWDVNWNGTAKDSNAEVTWGQQSPIPPTLPTPPTPPTPPLPPLFSYFAQDMVERALTEWQKKGEFEKVSDWQQRVNNETRDRKIKELTIEAEKEYIEGAADKETPYVLSKYDTENEVFLVTNTKYGKMLVPVPFDKAPGFRQQWEQTTKDVKYLIDNDTISIANILFTLPNGEQYTYNSKASLNYEVAQVNYNFAPIEIAAPTSESKGNQTITTTQRTIGVSDIDTNLPISNEKQDNTFAVIIANENYQKEAQVPFATNDGRTFADYCKKTMGIPDNNIHIATDATLNNMKYEINWLKQVIEAYNGNARVIFYYAGHGIPDESAKTAYLLPVDGFGNDVSTGYKLDDLYSTLGNLPSKSVTIFMDACFSGANRNGEMLASARGVAIKAKNSAPVGNMVVFSAAQGDETAYPNNEQQHGMFTYYLLKKIKETAGNVTYKELGDYVTDNVRKQSIVVNGKSQTPTVVPSATVGGTWETWKLK